MASKTKKIAATPTAISSFYGRVSEKSNAVRAELPVFRLSGANSETVSRESGGIDGERTIRKFRIVAPEAALWLRSYLPRGISS